MQETLSQLSDLNNDAIVESSRTARKLSDEHWGAVEGDEKPAANGTPGLVDSQDQ